ncbi:cardiolipin synthase [Paenibacillus lignilyticus]|uniref:Cardiolipin synthase n=1 Tax=Paenibacillus lignilyticus TaxID=1172615 RepID=A0ABS5C8P2_9BACL|nr:cardiolipin synthase [Paenibacillus lignilyticus]MBP3962378.1 cardiolipin synthase [Paenibacillus lignilyticus]
MGWILAALLIFIFQIATILALEYRRPAKTVAWLLILFVLPVIGFVMYYFLAQAFKRQREFRINSRSTEESRRLALSRCGQVHRPSDMHGEEFAEQERLYHMLQRLTLSPITSRNESAVLTDAEAAYSAVFQAIEEAGHHIHIEFYTIRDDRVGQRLKELLIRQARAGIEVRVIYDGIGSVSLGRSYVKELEQAGVELRCFLPPRIAFFDKRMNFRNHRKIVVVDGLVGYLGGINIGDEYLGGNPKLGFWRDTHLQLKGDAVYFLQEVFMQDWWYTSKEQLADPIYMPPHSCTGSEQVQIVASGPNSRDEAILECVFAAVSVAKSRIYIETPYFIPDPSLLMGLRTAALSGVDVRIIIPYVPDTKLVLSATLSYVEEMLAAGVRIYRYRKGFMHAKVLIVDHLLASVGTANMDMRSFFSNFEINALLFDEKAIDRLETDFVKDMEDSGEVTREAFMKRPLRQKAGEAVARMLSPLL